MTSGGASTESVYRTKLFLRFLVAYQKYFTATTSNLLRAIHYETASESCKSSDPSFVLPECFPSSPNALCNPGLVDVVHQVSGRSRIAPQTVAAAAGWREAPQLHFALVAQLPAGVLVSPAARATSISPRGHDHCPPPPRQDRVKCIYIRKLV